MRFNGFSLTFLPQSYRDLSSSHRKVMEDSHSVRRSICNSRVRFLEYLVSETFVSRKQIFLLDVDSTSDAVRILCNCRLYTFYFAHVKAAREAATKPRSKLTGA